MCVTVIFFNCTIHMHELYTSLYLCICIGYTLVYNNNNNNNNNNYDHSVLVMKFIMIIL